MNEENAVVGGMDRVPGDIYDLEWNELGYALALADAKQAWLFDPRGQIISGPRDVSKGYGFTRIILPAAIAAMD